MKRIVALAFLLAVQFSFIQDASAFKSPKAKEFKEFLDAALGACKKAKDSIDLQPEKCRKIVRECDPGCVKNFWNRAPAIFTNQSEIDVFGLVYLKCVLPGYFCNGIELRPDNVEQWQNKCLELAKPQPQIG